jgi:hypothetical protein
MVLLLVIFMFQIKFLEFQEFFLFVDLIQLLQLDHPKAVGIFSTELKYRKIFRAFKFVVREEFNFPINHILGS